MKVVFAIHHAGALRSFDGVVRHLCGTGCEVKIVHGEREKPVAMNRALKAVLNEVASCSEEEMLLRREWVRLANLRELLNCAVFLRPQHPNPSHARRWINKVRQPIRFAAKTRAGMRLLASANIQQALSKIEALTPPERTIIQWLRRYQPDVVFASPFISPVSGELEYVKAAQALGIPTVVAVLSWDNLTTKGTFHVMPDWVLVWNEALAQEAMRLHAVPPSKIVVTGAPVFDFWFNMQPSRSYSQYCRQVGINPQRPFILYLGSSPFIARDETPFVQTFANALLENPETRNLSVVVRPHPTNASFWDGFRADNVAVWPRRGEFVDSPDAKQDFYDSLYHSTAVLGVNTSAMLEAAIVDKPCVTIMTAHYSSTQGSVGHFQHLLDGDFLEIATGFGQASAILAGIAGGRDIKRDQRQRFVEDFIRPRGIDQAASLVMAQAIATAARGNDIQD